MAMTRDETDGGGSGHARGGIEDPPETVFGILRRLGPGLIIAGSIVGSGELIATTAVGAEAGFWLFWIILIGCVIKVFTQVELGRYSIVSGRTTMEALDQVPGPRVSRGNWLVWYFLLMFLAGLGQLGGIVGGVGQALSLSIPLTENGRRYNAEYNERLEEYVEKRTAYRYATRDAGGGAAASPGVEATADLESLAAAAREARARLDEYSARPRSSHDDKIWAAIVALATAGILVVGRYGLIQAFATVLVFSFTAITIGNLFSLQSHAGFAVGWSELLDGLKFRLPPSEGGEAGSAESGADPLRTALATFGIIGVGAMELIQYPYWCLEKGYARFTGLRDDSPEWARRARGWMRVMQWDAWCSMIVYTFATVAFYLLGAAILWRTELNPKSTELVRTLAVMYEPVFGDWAPILFLFGAFAVLYSTFFVANASHARVFPDTLRVFGLGFDTPRTRRRGIVIFSAVFPILCLIAYLVVQAPKELILASGSAQAIMLPMLAASALYFRFRHSDPRVRPGRAWDLCLWASALGMLVTGAAMLYTL